ncbi:hypothetical protein K2Z84_24775, partial [Candidatus Binatia bacterium]|nr:hypothetical protein [Candidatus Binatia bacterium]
FDAKKRPRCQAKARRAGALFNILLGEPPGEGFTDYQENSPAFQSVYLGCRMEPEARARVISHARTHLPAMRIFQASPSDTAFALTFEELAV